MPSDAFRAALQKAVVYDLEKIVERDPRETFAKDEIKALMDAYILEANKQKKETGILWLLPTTAPNWARSPKPC